MTDIVFEALPATARTARGTTSRPYRNHREIAAALRDRPGQWARIAAYPSENSASTIAHFITTARLASYAPAGAFEAAARTVDGEHRVYARYTPEGSRVTPRSDRQEYR